MTKLKTLNDIEADANIHWEGDYTKNKYVKRIAVSDDLRQAAREWIKELEKEKKKGNPEDWIKHFFNLEE